MHIPYRGAAPAMQGLLAGDVEILIDTVVIPHIKAGTVRGLAAVGPARLDEAAGPADIGGSRVSERADVRMVGAVRSRQAAA